MQVLESRIDVNSTSFGRNRAAMLELIEGVRRLEEQALAGGGERQVARHRSRGKLTVRERIELLLDRDRHFLELSPLAAANTDFPIGGGIVTGIGVVSGVECVVVGNDATVKGGSVNPYTAKKWLRALAIAAENRLPMIHLTESGGGDLPTQAESFVEAGRVFCDMSRLSRARVPTVSVVFGNATAGGAYVPGMSDYTVMIRERSKVFLGGPPLVKMATGEETDDERLGGAEMHASVSGVADYLADDEHEALRIARGVLAHLNWRKQGPGRSLPDDPPLYDPAELLGVVPADQKAPMDAREVLARVCDGSRFEEFKPLYGSTLVTGWASVHGFPVGLITNDGVLFSEAAEKASQFIGLCNQIDVPILFLQNTTGYVVGTEYERRGIIKDGAKMVRAVSNSKVPQLTLMIGASYGAGNYGMAGRGYAPRFVFTWPNHRIGIMGAKQMGGVLSLVSRAAAEAAGRPFDEELDARARAAVEEQLERESTALFATGRLWDDGIVDPRQSRDVLGIALSAVHSAEVRGTTDFGAVRM